MFSKVILVLAGLSLGCCVNLEDTELLLTFVVFRYGERTPADTQLVYSDDPATLAELTEPWGYGELIDEGKRRGLYIGEFLRSRYDGMLSERYNSSELYFRSTDFERTKMTGLTAMAGLYPAVGDKWSDSINWNPVPYTTAPMEYDFMLPSRSCQRFITYMATILSGDAPLVIPELSEFQDMLAVISRNTGLEYTTHPHWLYNLHSTYLSELALGMTLQDWVQEIYDELADATDILTTLMFSPEDAIKLNGGRLLNDFLATSRSIISGEPATQRVRVYSAHDVNVSGLMAAARVLSGYQSYGATFALELRRDVGTQEYYVLPVHLASPGESEVQYLQVAGCSDVFCGFEEFFSLTSSHAVNQTEYEYLCINGDAIAL